MNAFEMAEALVLGDAQNFLCFTRLGDDSVIEIDVDSPPGTTLEVDYTEDEGISLFIANEVVREMIEQGAPLRDVLERGCTSRVYAGQQVEEVLVHCGIAEWAETLRQMPAEWWVDWGINVLSLTNETITRLLKDAPDLMIPGQGFLQDLEEEDISARADSYWKARVRRSLNKTPVDVKRAWQELLKAASGYTLPNFAAEFKAYRGRNPDPFDWIEAERHWQASTDAIKPLLAELERAIAKAGIELPTDGPGNWVTRRLQEGYWRPWTVAKKIAGYFAPKKKKK